MTDTNTLIEQVAGLTAKDLFLNNSAESRLSKVEKEALSVVFDVTTNAGRAACIKQAAMVTKTKTAVEKIGKALVDPLKADAKKVDADRRVYKEGFERIKNEVRKPVTLWEEEEARKVAVINKAFADLENHGVATSTVTGDVLSEAQLNAKLANLEAFELGVLGDEFDMRAEVMLNAGLTRIKAALQQRKDADELAELRRMKAAKERDDRMKEEKRIIEAEVIARHEAEKAAAEAKEYDMPNHAPMSKILPEAAPKPTPSVTPTTKPTPSPSKTPWLDKPAPAAKKPIDINAALIRAFCDIGGIEAGQARKILAAIQQGEIDNISINY